MRRGFNPLCGQPDSRVHRRNPDFTTGRVADNVRAAGQTERKKQKEKTRRIRREKESTTRSGRHVRKLKKSQKKTRAGWKIIRNLINGSVTNAVAGPLTPTRKDQRACRRLHPASCGMPVASRRPSRTCPWLSRCSPRWRRSSSRPGGIFWGCWATGGVDRSSGVGRAFRWSPRRCRCWGGPRPPRSSPLKSPKKRLNQKKKLNFFQLWIEYWTEYVWRREKWECQMYYGGGRKFIRS